ncbi:MAG TPA: HAD-IA family hydrolase [Paludibacter sp.]|nr:HAD-IA family hydrolase [Paludibacter sp.]
MNNNKYIIFDFDGTIANSIELALNIYNRIAPDYKCKPIHEEFRDLLSSKNPKQYFKEYGITTLKLFLLVFRIRKELGKHVADIKPVNNIVQTIYELKVAGYKLGIITSNSSKNVRKFLENNNLSDVFDFVHSASNLFGKDKVFRRLFKRNDISVENSLYIGDETRDIEASKKSGIPVIAVSWGLTRRQILETLHPDQIAGEPKELMACVQNIFNNRAQNNS